MVVTIDGGNNLRRYLYGGTYLWRFLSMWSLSMVVTIHEGTDLMVIIRRLYAPRYLCLQFDKIVGAVHGWPVL